MTDPDLLLRAAFAQHQAGALTAAADLYRQVLERRPADHDALHLLGVARAALGDPAAGIALIRQAIAVSPGMPSPHFNLGGLLLAQGHTEPALHAFRACLALAPTHAAALTAAARALHALGRQPEAADHYTRALALTPADATLWTELATARLDSGQLTQALRSCDQALRLRPDHAGTHYIRGCVLLRQQAFDRAEMAFKTTLSLQPAHRPALLNLGFAQEAQARGQDALLTFEQLLILDPDNSAARLQRGLLLNALNRHAEAVTALTAALETAPDHPQALAARGGAFRMLNDWDQAAADLDRALFLDPNNVPALIDRGNALQDLQRYDAALDCYDKALALDPASLTALMNRGGALQSLQRNTEALATYQKVLDVCPGHDDALLSVSLCQLRAGAWRDGWIDYETRLRQSPWTEALPTFSGPRWDGIADLRGKRVLLASEQGLGDTIQFARFARLPADRGAKVILGVEKPLRRLMQSLAGVSDIAVPDESDPVYDFYLPLMSLIAASDLGPEAVATGGPYLRADPDATAAWRTRLAALPGLKAGLAWAGDPRPHDRTAHLMDRRRSIALDRLGPLLAVDGVTFVSVQKGHPARPPIVDWTNELADFADTAALIEALDLVISVDTAVAHAAGALGRPVWVLNRFDRCWRWMSDRTDTPWYPTMRLFTQPAPGEWDAVVADVAAALAATAKPC